ncbi:MAG: hypothetical protein HS115_16545 [Spirochaetales bacterium]|nr:hypothetical protein [Spirochaetales bacterium]
MCRAFLAVAVVLVQCSGVPLRESHSCQQATDLPGGAHLEYNSEHNRILVSAQERRSHTPSGDFMERGDIFRLIGNGFDRALPMRITGRDDFPFHPTGIALIESGRPVLLVLNRAIKQMTVVEKYLVKRRELEFFGRIHSPLFLRSEHIAAVSENEFYVTNTIASSSGLRLLGWITGIEFQEIVYYLNGETIIASSPGNFTGIALSPDLQVLYAGRKNGQLTMFRRDSGTLQKQNEFSIGGTLQGLHSERSGTILVSSVNSRMKFFLHRQSGGFTAPSRIWRLDPSSGQKELVYADNARVASGVTDAIHLSGRLVLAQAYRTASVACSL